MINETKKSGRINIYIDPEIAKKARVMSAQLDMTLGNFIEGLIAGANIVPSKKENN